MPEVWMSVRLPDGSTEHCYSPSTVLEARFAVGTRHPAAVFLERIQAVLVEASERVFASRGFYCTGAAAESTRLAQRLAGFVADPAAVVEILGLSRARPAAQDTPGEPDETLSCGLVSRTEKES
ncbi:MSMEG_0570 family nitrogen starvation response protein [Haliangium ochraceum]|uniref:MSMEG_0570 family nitrogen starvation response protein n=1 Tax=Haliangium ochraceum (strain DSM 14365 / JCM 11303 / SMP-2) TaxID=502025 RepID=D0LSL5_HALO1|nr:MSMEG_0570 family nitrogen starvation response protein [Haliangium ochraceum]ACY17237.1 hypothetical protein Hoch_4747 [Haliangium ochraceum DSM 14365]